MYYRVRQLRVTAANAERTLAMVANLATVEKQIRILEDDVFELGERLDVLEAQDLHGRLIRMDERLDAQAKDYQDKLTRLAEIVADLSTR